MKDAATPLPMPRLAVISDVAVERTAAGSLLLYRLLADYPPDRLLAVDAGSHPNFTGDRRIPGVAYHSIPYSVPRAIRSRFNPAGPLMMTVLVKKYSQSVLEAIESFQPEAILTVSCKYLWVSAAAAARQLHIPLHLILHDDWTIYETQRKKGWMHSFVRLGLHRVLGKIYRQAATRYCVSPGMEERCRRLYGPPGKLLYPSRGDDSPVPKVRVRANRGAGGPVVAFCGHIHQGGTIPLLKELADILSEQKGHLDLYTNYSEADLGRMGLTSPSIRGIGFFPPKVMAEKLGETADALFLPASFDHFERDDVATLFPSKLTDYTATGLPILIWGPEYCSAARWATARPGTAALVAKFDKSAVSTELARLVADREYAAALASTALAAGNEDFDLAAIRRVFNEGLQTPGTSPLGYCQPRVVV